ncbi:MAG: hypothetical protein RSC57_00095 [Bacilli bacterium]
MKKFILIVCMFIFSIVNVRAYSSWEDKLPDDTSNMKIETDIKYRWYKLEKSENYDLYDESKKEFIDYNDKKYTEYSKESLDVPAYKRFRETKELSEPIVIDHNNMNSVYIMNFAQKNMNDENYISEFVVRNRRTKETIDFELSGKNNDEVVDVKSLINGDVTDNAFKYYFSTIFNIKFKEMIAVDDFELVIYFKSFNTDKKSLTVKVMQDNRYEIASCNLEYYDNTVNLSNQIDHKIINNRDIYWKRYYSFTKYTYIYRDTLFKYNIINKKYAEGYFNKMDGFIRDDLSAKVFYRYEKIEPVVDTQTIYNYVDVPIKREVIVRKEEIINSSLNNIDKDIKDDNLENEEPTSLGAITNEKIAYADKNKKENINMIPIYTIFSLLTIICIIIFIKLIVEKCHTK